MNPIGSAHFFSPHQMAIVGSKALLCVCSFTDSPLCTGQHLSFCYLLASVRIEMWDACVRKSKINCPFASIRWMWKEEEANSITLLYHLICAAKRSASGTIQQLSLLPLKYILIGCFMCSQLFNESLHVRGKWRIGPTYFCASQACKTRISCQKTLRCWFLDFIFPKLSQILTIQWQRSF